MNRLLSAISTIYHKLKSLVFKPIYDSKNGTFECNIGTYYQETSHTTIISQISGFGNIAGEVDKQYSWVVFDLEGLSFLTDIAYLVLSSTLLIPYIIPQKNRFRFVLKRVFFLVIFISVVECFFEYALYCTPRNVDIIFFFILTTVLTRSISSFFPNDREVRVKDIKKYGKLARDKSLDMYKFVFLHINDYEKVSNFLGHQRLYLEIEKGNEEAKKFADKVREFYVKREYEEVINFYLEQLSNEKKFFVANKSENSKGDLSIVERIIFEKFQRPIGRRVLKEKVEKSRKEVKSSKKVKIEDTEKNNDKIKIKIKDTEVEWIVIPELMVSYANEKDYYKKLDTEIEYCKKIEYMLNNEKDEEEEIPNDNFVDD
ncbi:hypothetical protein C2G38_2241801 [Gigaspora rosea]|uniref:Uncharacterized protein n=1 Tax=Gigaspora rosea TaxID=44941 RepID=A0A397VSQ8_9GLOM|nr:hypothetical protein C2G38_2241801 [Gigaspora rosea]